MSDVAQAVAGLSDAHRLALEAAARAALARHVAGGALAFPMEAHMVRARA